MPTDSAPTSGSRLDDYRLVKLLAMGGMAEIYLAQDERSGRTVALKKVLPHIASDPDFMNRFFHEIRIQISLKHRNVVELLDCSPGAPNAYIVMEYVDGGSLQSLLERSHHLPWELALYVVEETLRGLGAAHRKGIIHRDVKPQNVMWTKDGAVKIADFGISQAEHLTRLTVTGTVVGTPSYMSPEQARGETLDPRSDLFSAGTVLYALLTGHNPFTADNVTATLRRVVDVSPDAPSLLDATIPPAVDRVVRRLHAKARDGRFATAEEAGEAIRGVFAAEGVERPAELFRAFLADPTGFVATKKQSLAATHAAEAEKLLADRQAAPEEALWAAYQTVVCAPEDPRARELYKAAATRVGQREKPVENARIRSLEEQLRSDPENVGLLLQLAKLYRLERDFLNVMRFFRKLKTLAPDDAYTQGQIAALVGGGPPEPAGARPAEGTARAHPVAPRAAAPPAEPERRASRPLVWGVAAVVALLVAGVLWLRGPGRKLTTRTAEDEARAETLVRLLKGPKGSGGEAATAPVTPEAWWQKVSEKGALLERERGPAQALEFYRQALPTAPRDDVRASLLAVLAETAERAGDEAVLLEALDQAIALGGAARTAALLKKADLLEKRRDETGARRIWEDLARGEDGPARLAATLKLGMSADRAGDAERALVHYEEIISKAPNSPESLPARLGAGALYRDAGRKADARRMFEEVKALAPPGSDFEKSAESGLRSLG